MVSPMNPRCLSFLRPLVFSSIALIALAFLTGGDVIRRSANAQASRAPCAPAKKGEKIPMDFKDVPIRDVTRLVGCALELNLVFSPPDLGDRRVTVFAPRPVPATELIRVLQSALRDASLVLEKRGSYGVIRESAKRAQRPSKRRSNRGRYP